MIRRHRVDLRDTIVVAQRLYGSAATWREHGSIRSVEEVRMCGAPIVRERSLRRPPQYGVQEILPTDLTAGQDDAGTFRSVRRPIDMLARHSAIGGRNYECEIGRTCRS